MNRLIAAVRRRVSHPEEGFTVMEVAVAFSVLFISLLALARTATVAFSDTANARQRQAGYQIANQLLEQVRALPYDSVKKGLLTTDLAGDPNIVTCSGVAYFRTCPPNATAEQIVHSAGLSTTTPLVPHRGTSGPPLYPSTYSWSVYVTQAVDVPAKGAYRVTAIVTWTAGARTGVARRVEAQTLLYSPEGCADTATHPFAAPCQPFISGGGTVGGGGFETTGTISGLTYDSVTGSFLAQTADLRVEQVGRVEGNVTLPGASRTVAGIETMLGGGAASVADNDPSTTTTEYERQSAGPQSAGSVSVTGSDNALSVSLGSGAQLETISTVAARGAQACNLQVDSQPCAYAQGAQTGAISHTLTEKDAGTATLVSVGTTSTPVTTYARRTAPSGTNPGLIREQISWRLPEIRIGGIPSTIATHPNWAGYWVRLRDFTATASAEAGTGTVAPAVSITGGTVDAWSGGGYNSFSVAASAGSGATIPINTVTASSTSSGKQRRVDISGEVAITPSTTTETVLSGTTRTEAEATIGSPLTVTMNYVVTVGNSVEANLTVVFTAGSATATATYQPL